MACYICAECGRFIDNDYDPCTEHPTVKFGLMCTDCAAKLEEEADENGGLTHDQECELLSNYT